MAIIYLLGSLIWFWPTILAFRRNLFSAGPILLLNALSLPALGLELPVLVMSWPILFAWASWPTAKERQSIDAQTSAALSWRELPHLLLGKRLPAALPASTQAGAAASANPNRQITPGLREFLAETTEALLQLKCSFTSARRNHHQSANSYLELLEQLAWRSLQQCRHAQLKSTSVQDCLAEKLLETELTFHNYSQSAEKALLLASENLTRVVGLLKNIDIVDILYISERISALAQSENSQEQAELEALNERSRLCAQATSRIRGLLAQNETTLTMVDQLSWSLSDLALSKGKQMLHCEDTLQELELLCERVRLYSPSSSLPPKATSLSRALSSTSIT